MKIDQPSTERKMMMKRRRGREEGGRSLVEEGTG